MQKCSFYRLIQQQAGLAVGCTIIAALAYSVLAYMTGNFKFADYLNIFYLQGAGELSVFCSAMVGAGLGFLWFNSYPATVFMGDTGSLALGGGLGVVAVFIKKELLLFLVGGIFVIEAVSVLLQVIWFKTTKKRLFLMSPRKTPSTWNRLFPRRRARNFCRTIRQKNIMCWRYP